MRRIVIHYSPFFVLNYSKNVLFLSFYLGSLLIISYLSSELYRPRQNEK